MTAKKPRYYKTGGYSTEFTPKTGAGKSYALTRIPADLWTAVRRKARAEKTSVRTVILRLLRDWTGR